MDQPQPPNQPGWGPPNQTGYPPQQGNQPQQGYPPQGYPPQPGPGYPPPSYGYPPYGMPPARFGLNPLGRIASALLVLFGALTALGMLFIFLTGKPAGLEPEGFTGPVIPDNTVAGFIVVLFFVGLAEAIVGLFAFSGREWARWFGVFFAVVYLIVGGLVFVAGRGLGIGGGSMFLLLLIAAHLYIIVALSAAWRFKPR